MKVTTSTYKVFSDAYDYFNKDLFGGVLPDCLITLAFYRSAYGYFRPDAFGERDVEGRTHEIALNPFTFKDRSNTQIFSTLVHEMVHLWQQVYGKPTKKAGHNREWAEKMKELGLQPTSTGAPGGKETGRRVTHLIIQDGAFDKSWNKRNFTVPYIGHGTERAKQPSRRVRYCCPKCELNAYAKPDVRLTCTECAEKMLVVSRTSR